MSSRSTSAGQVWEPVWPEGAGVQWADLRAKDAAILAVRPDITVFRWTMLATYRWVTVDRIIAGVVPFDAMPYMLRNSDARSEIRRLAFTSKDTATRRLALRTLPLPEEDARTEAHFSGRTFGRPGRSVALAGNQFLSDGCAEILSGSDSIEVRRTLAANRHIGFGVMRMLASDDDFTVRRALWFNPSRGDRVTEMLSPEFGDGA